MGKPRTVYRVIHKLVTHPVFPIMFIQEAVKCAVTGNPYALHFTVLAVITTLLWAASDTIDIEIKTENGFLK